MERESCDVFLSYSSKDADIVDAVKERLEAKGYRVWLDTFEVLAGENIIERVFSGIAGCRYFAIFLTPRSVESSWVRNELSTAKIHELEGKVRVLPVLYEDCRIPDALSATNYVDLRYSFQRGMDQLEKSLQTYEKRREASPSPASAKLSVESRLGENKSKLLSAMSAAGKLFMAMDLGGTKAYVSLMNGEAERLFDRKFSTTGHGDPERLFDFVKECIRQTVDGVHEACGISRYEVERRIEAIGIAFPGPTDFEQGVVLNAPNLRISDFPLAARMRKTFEKPTFVDNDVNLGVLGEAWKGAAKTYRNVVGIIIGTGIGGGVVIDGRIYRGATKAAGELGHMVVDADSEYTCPCGQHGCFEALASRKSMARDLRARKLRRGDTDLRFEERNLGTNDIVHLYEIGDPDAIDVVDNAARICGKAVFSILNAFNPEIILFSGGFIEQLADKQLGEVFLKPVLKEAEKCMDAVYGSGDKKVPIRIGSLDNAMLVGACKMLVDSTAETTRRDRVQILAAAVGRLGGRDLQLLRSLYREPTGWPISKNPGSDFHEDSLRALRNHGLIQTDGQSFRRSTKVQVTELGRFVVEEQASR